MGQQYTISQLAKAAEVPTTTVRYYERIGLVEPEDRSQGNYRLYSEESLSKRKFIRAAQTIGFSLDNVKSLLGIHGGRKPSCGKVQTLIEERLADIGRHLKDLRHVKRVLTSTLERCKETEQAQDCCQVIEALNKSSR